MKNRIPKIINCIWLSDQKKSSLVNKCVQSWKENVKNYKIQEWNIEKFEAISKEQGIANPLELKYVKGAIEQEKWAFASDYLRQWILYYVGGIYLDEDIYLCNSAEKFFDKNLDEQFVSCMELHYNVKHLWKDLIYEDGRPKSDKFVPGICIQAAFLMGQKGNEFSHTCIKYYEDKEFVMHHDDLKAVNTEANPDEVKPEAGTSAKNENGTLTATLQSLSWNVIRLSK